MPDVDSTLRQIVQWRHIITTDLTSTFYQIPLSRESINIPWLRSVGSGCMPVEDGNAWLRNCLARTHVSCTWRPYSRRSCCQDRRRSILRSRLTIPEELLHNWKRVLQALCKCNLKLSTSKTVINPKSTVILGWIWDCGTIQASPHRITALASCRKPETVGRLKSFIDAYKVLARVIPLCSTLLSPLDTVVAARQSHERINWSDDLLTSFHCAQFALSASRSISLPRPDDHLWIITDGALINLWIGATQCVTLNNKLQLAGFFRAKLRGR